MKYDTFWKKHSNRYLHQDFVNKHGEKFKVIREYPRTLITGDEFEWELSDLFHKNFNIYTDEEIGMLGEALIKLSKGETQ